MLQASTEQRPPEASWNGWYDDPLLFFTFVLAVATVILGISTTLLWLTTRKLAIDTKEAGDAQASKMERSATAMEGVKDSMAINAAQIVRSVDMQRRFGQMQLRPYLTVLVGQGEYQDENLRFAVRPKVLNTGHTPARDVRWRIGIEIVSPEQSAEFKFPLPSAAGGNMISPHQEYFLSAILDRRVDDADAIRDGDIQKGMVFVYGCVSYRDNMKRRYLTTFAQQVWRQLDRDPVGNIKGSHLRGRYLYKHNRAN